jgi:FtsH-binding integral membrane protein
MLRKTIKMRKNFRVLTLVLTIAGITCLLFSFFMQNEQLKMLLFYITGGLLVAVLVCYFLYSRKPELFRNKSDNPGGENR